MPKRSLPNRSCRAKLMIDQLDQSVTELLAAPNAKLHAEDPELVATAARRRRTTPASARRFQGPPQI